MSPQVNLVVGNTWTHITHAEPFILDVLDKELQYPSPAAQAMNTGWKAPADYGGWDGWIRLLRKPKTQPWYFPTGLLPRVIRICKKFQHTGYVRDTRERPPEGYPDIGAGSIPLRPYQEEAVQAAVAAGRGILDMPPRSGKTRTMIEIHRQLSLPTVWIAPTDRIVDQTRQAIAEFYGDGYVMHLKGSKLEDEAAKKHVVVCTAAMAAGLSEDFYKTRQLLVVDEWHHSAAKTYRKIFKLCDHVYYRYGMTGTHYRSGQDELEMHGLISEVVYCVDTRDLLDLGHLVPTHVAFIPVPKNPMLRGVPKVFQGGHGTYGIHEHEGRNTLVVSAAYSLLQAGRKVLILVGTKKQGRIIRDALRAWLPKKKTEFSPVEFVSTDTDRGRQRKILDAYLDTDEVRVLIGTTILGEGVDLPVVDALVYARGEQAEVSLKQAAYRVCTATQGKRDAIIVDFADRHHRKLRGHSHERLDVYLKEPIFSVSVLEDSKDFGPWVRAVGGEG